MRTFYACLAVLGIFARYLLSRLGLAQRTRFIDHLGQSKIAAGFLFRWRTRLRVIAPEHCPSGHPAVFVGNHLKLDDPIFAWAAIDRASRERISVRFMMRDDFFVGFPWTWLPINMDDICEMCGAVRISRTGVQLSQVKPLIHILQTPGSFLMFPGWSRSRSGLVMEYRGIFDEPGGVAFFVAHAQRRAPGLRVAAVPLTRTFNPVNRQSAVVFGEPLYLEADANRARQREHDFALAVRISELVEINMAHLLAGILYLHCLHQRPPRLLTGNLQKAVKTAAAGITGRYVDPAVMDHFDREFDATLRFFQRYGMLSRSGETITLNCGAILAVPPLETNYRKQNPVKFQVNQILHLADVVAQIERAAENLDRADK